MCGKESAFYEPEKPILNYKNRRKMKKLMMILMIALGVSSVAFGQTKMMTDPKTEAQLIALEKAGWEAWKNKDASWVTKKHDRRYFDYQFRRCG